jgi:hypothetical protein
MICIYGYSLCMYVCMYMQKNLYCPWLCGANVTTRICRRTQTVSDDLAFLFFLLSPFNVTFQQLNLLMMTCFSKP